MKTGAMKQVSQEVIPQYAADYMFITDYNPNGESKTFERLKDSSVWKNLDAVKHNRVFINDFNTFYPYDPIAVSKQMDIITDMLIKRAEENKNKKRHSHDTVPLFMFTLILTVRSPAYLQI